MNRDELQQLWRASWDGEGWIASWRGACADLSAAQAGWKPSPDRHSIWQNVNHVIFWRDFTSCIAEGRPKPSQEQTERLNFADRAELTDAAWRKTLADLEKSHRDIEAIIGDQNRSIDRVKHHLSHDPYHLGQIMLLRALQGLKPLV